MNRITVVTNKQNQTQFQGSQIDSGIYMAKRDGAVEILDNQELKSKNLKGIQVKYNPIRFCGLEYSKHHKKYIDFGGCRKSDQTCKCYE